MSKRDRPIARSAPHLNQLDVQYLVYEWFLSCYEYALPHHKVPARVEEASARLHVRTSAPVRPYARLNVRLSRLTVPR